MKSNYIEVDEIQSETPWIINCDGYFKRSVSAQMIEDGMKIDSINSIYSNAVHILKHCPCPSKINEVSKTGIVIGKVQSGKTSNFISLLSLAFDNDYEIAIVLGGNTLELLKQNASRISSSFNVDSEKLTVLKTADNKSLINTSRIKEFIENGRKVIIVGLKHYKHIKKISDIFNDDYLSNKPVLIIDDEGDQATLNTKAFLSSMSSTYESVLELKKRINKHCFLSVTATPQANIFIQVFDNLSPDFGELVYPGDGYCGLNEFHSAEFDYMIREISENESNLLDDVGIPESVIQSIALFFVGNAIRRCRGDYGNHAMLIHPSQKKFDHRNVVNKLQNVLDSWKKIANLKSLGINDISFSPLRNQLVEAYQIFCNDGVITKAFDDLEPYIIDVIKKCSPVHICNSDENATENSKLYKTNIFVGGNLVERGITIKGLAMTYITRRAKGKSNVDNTEQRARWFGYKDEYLDVCRVYTTKDIKDDFISILEHDEDVWATIERAKVKGIPFKEIPRIFKLTRSTYLNLTRKNVAISEQFQLSEWKFQKYLQMERNLAIQNSEIISTFKDSFGENYVIDKYNEFQVHKSIVCDDFSQFYDNVLGKLNYNSDEILNKNFFLTLLESFNKLEIVVPVKITWIRDNNYSTRKINSDNTIQQLFQGRNPNITSNKYYEGDRSLVEKNTDLLQFQIHYVKPTNLPHIDYYSPVIAIYIPNDLSNKLSELVVRYNDK